MKDLILQIWRRGGAVSATLVVLAFGVLVPAAGTQEFTTGTQELGFKACSAFVPLGGDASFEDVLTEGSFEEAPVLAKCLGLAGTPTSGGDSEWEVPATPLAQKADCGTWGSNFCKGIPRNC